jgi:hypothetical protein
MQFAFHDAVLEIAFGMSSNEPTSRPYTPRRSQQPAAQRSDTLGDVDQWICARQRNLVQHHVPPIKVSHWI